MGVSRQKVIQTAEKLVARGRLQAAISEYRKVLEATPNDTSMLNRVGDLYARLNQVDKATRLFRQTAENFARQGFFVKAIAIYKKIIRLDPSQIAAYESLAGLYARQGLTNEALGQYQVVADYFLKHDDRPAAVAIYRNMIEVDAENPRYRLRLAGLLQEAGDLPGALEQYHEIATLMLAHGRSEEAAQVYTSALDVDSTDTGFLVLAAGALRQAGNESGAERLFSLVAERSAETAAAARAELERARAEEAEAEEEELGERRKPFWVAEETEEPAAEVETVEEAEAEAVEETIEGAQAEAASMIEGLEEGEEGEELVLDLDSPELDSATLETLIEEPSAASEPEAAVTGAESADAAELDFELVVEEPVSSAELEEELESRDGETAEASEPSDGAAAAEEAEEAEQPAAVGETVGEEEEPAAPQETEGEEEEVALVEETEETGAVGAVAGPEAAETLEGTAVDAVAAQESVEAEAGERELAAQVAEEQEQEAEEVVRPGPETPDDRPTEIADRARGLLTEATVLSKYGMDEMAAACLEETLELDPDHVQAQGRLIHLQLSLGRRDEALIMANRFAELVSEGGEPEIWQQVVGRMAGEGFELQGGRFVATRPPEAVPTAEVVEAVEEESFEQPEEWAEEVEEAARREELEAEAAAARGADEEVEAAEPATEPAVDEESVVWRRETEETEPAAGAAGEPVEPEPAESEVAAGAGLGPEAGEVVPTQAADEERAADEETEEELDDEFWTAEGRGTVEVDTRRDLLDIATKRRRRPSEGGRPSAITPGDLLAGAEELLPEAEPTAAEGARPEPPAEPPAPPPAGRDVSPDLDLAAMAEELEAAAERFAASLGPAVPPGMGDEPSAEPPETAAPAEAEAAEEPAEAEAAWSDEQALGADEFFDLATELEAELLDAELEDDLLPPVQEQTIEEIVEGFRRGMEKSLSPEDYDTHYNLGIAYQEMGLVDEAIGEFQLAAKDPRYLVECCSLLAGCFQSKGYPELAVHWYERGLASPSIREDERLGLLYELGNLEMAVGARERARERFVEIYGISSTYRDVVAKLEELGRRPS